MARKIKGLDNIVFPAFGVPGCTVASPIFGSLIQRKCDLSVSYQALNRVLHHLSQVAPVRYRRIFSGVGLYHEEYLFGVMTGHRLYFRVDDISRTPYIERCMPALHPPSAFSNSSHFYQLPDAVLESPGELRYWMRAAVEATQGSDQGVTAGVLTEAPLQFLFSAG